MTPQNNSSLLVIFRGTVVWLAIGGLVLAIAIDLLMMFIFSTYFLDCSSNCLHIRDFTSSILSNLSSVLIVYLFSYWIFRGTNYHQDTNTSTYLPNIPVSNSSVIDTNPAALPPSPLRITDQPTLDTAAGDQEYLIGVLKKLISAAPSNTVSDREILALSDKGCLSGEEAYKLARLVQATEQKRKYPPRNP